ncbi:MAG: hypothetical protein AAFQ89_18365 [Cyanobacteria bacterium J06626_18]
MTTRYFIETDFDSPQLARQARDELAQHLAAQGLDCQTLTLLRATDGIKIFAIDDSEPEPHLEATPTKPRRPRTPSRRDFPPGTLRDRSTTATAKVAIR